MVLIIGSIIVSNLVELNTLLLDANLLQRLPLCIATLFQLRLLTLNDNYFQSMPAVVEEIQRDRKVYVVPDETEKTEREHRDGVVVCYDQYSQHRARRK